MTTGEKMAVVMAMVWRRAGRRVTVENGVVTLDVPPLRTYLDVRSDRTWSDRIAPDEVAERVPLERAFHQFLDSAADPSGGYIHHLRHVLETVVPGDGLNLFSRIIGCSRDRAVERARRVSDLARLVGRARIDRVHLNAIER